MAYQARPRFQAHVERRRADAPRPRRPSDRELVGAQAARRWEPTQVLDALNEMHNAPQKER